MNNKILIIGTIIALIAGFFNFQWAESINLFGDGKESLTELNDMEEEIAAATARLSEVDAEFMEAIDKVIQSGVPINQAVRTITPTFDEEGNPTGFIFSMPLRSKTDNYTIIEASY